MSITEKEYAEILRRRCDMRIVPRGTVAAKSRRDAPTSTRIVVHGEPVAKPRQTRSDKWKERPCVVRYREWADKARAAAGVIPEAAQHADIVIYLPIPQSLSAKKRQALAGMPHTVKPDIDNLIKSSLDALLKRDQGIHEVRAKKRWEDAGGPRVEITLY